MSPEGGDSATSKLVNQRQSRKKAEEDVKLLANRIALLKMEEKKVRSKKFMGFGRRGKRLKRLRRRQLRL